MSDCLGNGMPPSAFSGDGWLELAREVLDIEMEGLAAVRGQLGSGFLATLELLSACTGRVVVTGIGKSGLVARKIAATFSSTGTPAFFLHPVEGAHGDLGMIRKDDVVLALSNSGETDELNNLLPALRALGVSVVGITSGADSTLARLSQPVACLMHTDNLPVTPQTAPVSQALAALNTGGFGLVAVTDMAGRLAGVLTDGDVRRMLFHENGYNPTWPVSAFMTVNPRSVEATARSGQVLDLMEAQQITVLPVLAADGTLAGLVHVHDLLGKGRVRFAPE